MLARLASGSILALVASNVRLGSHRSARLEAWCAPADQGGHPNLCSGYLDTELELLASPDPTLNGGTRICVPADADRAKLVALIRDYARSHPSARDQDAVVGVGQSLTGEIPLSREVSWFLPDPAEQAE